MKRHPMDSAALVFALLFSAALTWWGIVELSDSTPRVPAAWIGAGTLLVIGLVGLISALRPQPKPAPATLNVPQEPSHTFAEPSDPYAELYADPYFHASGLKVGNDVLDADAVAAAYREAGFEEMDRRRAAAPEPALSSAEPGSGEEPAARPPKPTLELPRSEALTTEVPRVDAAETPTVEVPRSEGPTAVVAGPDARTEGFPSADAPTARIPRSDGHDADTAQVPGSEGATEPAVSADAPTAQVPRRATDPRDGPTSVDAEPEVDREPPARSGGHDPDGGRPA